MFFDRKAQIVGSDGLPIPDGATFFDCWIEEIPGGTTTARGESYDADGAIEVAAAPHLVRVPNRKLVIDGVKWAVVGAVEHEVLPHVQLTLAELRPAG